MKKNILIVMIFIALSLYFGSSYITSNSNYLEKIKSINLSTDYEISQALEDIDLLNANTVNIPIVINIDNSTSNNIHIDDYSKEKAINLIKQLKEKNINIILEPYPWINNGSQYETEYNPKDKIKFFNDWKNILGLLIDDIANKYHVDILVTGSSFTKLEKYDDRWLDIIKFVKEKFSGEITYKTSWWYTSNLSKNNYNKKLNYSFFNKVDFISIAAYFELSDKKENTVKELIKCLSSTTVYNRKQNVTKEIYDIHKKYNKQIFFGELGFPRKNFAASHPWNGNISKVYNNKEQARCFQAYKTVFENKNYIKGFSVFALGEKSNDKNFYPSKESIDVISSWYK